MSIQQALNKFIDNPYDDKVIFDLANSYYNKNQTASALTYYLRVTELDSDLVYSTIGIDFTILSRETSGAFYHYNSAKGFGAF